MAHAYACGAQMAVTNGAPWNIVFRSCGCCDVEQKRATLRDSWDVHDPGGWRATLEQLLSGKSGDLPATIVLNIRWQLVAYYRVSLDVGTWQGAVANWCYQNGNQEFQSELMESLNRIVRYETRMAHDGVLPPGGFVRGMAAYDFGRAVNFARWGVHAQYTDPGTAEAFIAHASTMSQRFYSSWADSSAGYILGRSLWFDQESFGDYYTQAVAAHHMLMNNPQSPWVNLPFM